MTEIVEEFNNIEQTKSWKVFFERISNEDSARCSRKTTNAALSIVNRSSNRYRDILPYDDTRVHLSNGSNDYINANFVQVPWANRKYIVTQGPLPSTIKQFWQMIWEQNSRVILMLTDLIEKGSVKCHLYYPDSQKNCELTLNDPDITVRFKSVREYRYYTCRMLELNNRQTDEVRTVLHWSELEWPDHGVPKNPDPFLHFLCDVRQNGAFDSAYGPPVVHCSAGIGRSGTFILIDSILKMLADKSNSDPVSLPKVLGHIRSQRQGLIQTVEQLRFSYCSIIAALNRLDQIEQSQQSYSKCHFEVSSDSEGDENIHDAKKYKTCDRQNNIMTSARLIENFDDLNYELMKRAESITSNYLPTPKSSSHDLTQYQFQYSMNEPSMSKQKIARGSDGSLRFRSVLSTPRLSIENESKSLSNPNPVNKRCAFADLLTRKYSYTILFGALIVLSGSYCFYRCFSNVNRNH